jgi:small subunit ribosomal protein S1
VKPAAEAAPTPSKGLLDKEFDLDAATEEALEPVVPQAPRNTGRVPLPNLREDLDADLESEFQAALAGAPMDDLIHQGSELTDQALLEPDSRHQGRVVAIRRDDVFVELGGREQGVIALRQFPESPEPGMLLEVRITRFNPEEGIYELSLPYSAAQIGDWSQVEEGMIVEARVSGHNTGGLECEVGHIRGFIPISQIALYRIEDASQFVGEKFTCLVTEANPERRNLVLSRRAVLEREQQEARDKLWGSLEPGQIHEGLVRKIMDFGAFVDLGGVDGLLHISQLGWGRVKHPSDVIQEGQRIQVKIQKIDQESKRISLTYRELLQNPWQDVEYKYPAQSTIHGRVTKLMEFGAFVELEPGVEGLVHISELANHRVWRVSDVVKEGDEVDAVVLSIDTQAKRISLSMKSLLAPEPTVEDKDKEEPEPLPPPKKPAKPTGPLRGGLGRAGDGARFGLKW